MKSEQKTPEEDSLVLKAWDSMTEAVGLMRKAREAFCEAAEDLGGLRTPLALRMSREWSVKGTLLQNMLDELVDDGPPF